MSLTEYLVFPLLWSWKLGQGHQNLISLSNLLMSKLYIHENWVGIQRLVHKLFCRRKCHADANADANADEKKTKQYAPPNCPSPPPPPTHTHLPFDGMGHKFSLHIFHWFCGRSDQIILFYGRILSRTDPSFYSEQTWMVPYWRKLYFLNTIFFFNYW